MSKLICYSLFSAPCEPFERAAYMRGFYFNARMNNLIYPDWRTHLEVDRITYDEYKGLFDWLVTYNNLSLHVNETTPPLCTGMLWRMKPLFTIDVSHILCRDSDALTNYREAQAVQVWIENDFGIHCIHDNPAHGGLMGGMVGFDTSKVKAACEWNSWEEMISDKDFALHGSDQNFLNNTVLPKADSIGLLVHKTPEINILLPQVDSKFWESNLCSSFIGSAGFNELETLRFFKRMDEYSWKYKPIEKQYPQLFYWHL